MTDVFEQNKDNRSIGFAFAIITIFASLGMMHGDSTLSTPFERRLLSIPNYLCTFFIMYKLYKGNRVYAHSFRMLFCVLIWWMLYSFHSLNDGLLSPFYLVILTLFCFSPSNTWLFSLLYFRYYLIITSILGIIAYLSIILSISLPYEIIPYYSTFFEAYYLNFKFTYILMVGVSLRLCGLFNEPGAFATCIVLCLIADNYNLKKKSNLILFVAALFTLSLAFFLISFIFLLLYYARSRKIILFPFIAIIIYILLYLLSQRFEMIDFFFNRLNYEESSFSRVTNDFQILYDRMFSLGDQWFGYGAGYSSKRDLDSSGYKPIILEHGLIGYSAIMVSFALACILNVKKNYYIYPLLICFAAVLYKAGYPYHMEYLVIVFGGIEYLKNNKKDGWIYNKIIFK